MNNLLIGRLIKELRIKKKLSMVQFAKKVQLSQPSLSRIENGNQELSLSALSKICFELDTSLTEFFQQLEVSNSFQEIVLNKNENNQEHMAEELETKLIEMITELSLEQKKALYTLLFPYSK
ncbi:helix-turn-helix domain-containing protein [Alkalihalobacterium chitinilyticum]|uniref:Helix-turn-helix domain-containing protein n=1 Tax=Alkalihalobacterium chitinilyticum TaxID=2980103 RepID=A0ABT5VF94_9BACI|nr:helix-turn-helix transcriptional regulator [Alkalihalobacterium chitinilyticum]MDE5414126.1 helix-turn-helix domain-containing protein [Alkalihalobacterium chitinilyticum]